MGLSRLNNFIKSIRGNIIYVDPNSLDSTDSIENQGNSLTRPFKTIQRALIESARFSYQKGLKNDRFAKTTILLYPGDHLVDNRPGWIPDGENTFRLRTGATSSNFPELDTTSRFDLLDFDNQLYKFNSIHGGVIIPRGTSIIGLDLRKTKIRPLYVPNPTNNNIGRSCIFRVTGSAYLWQFSIFDADPNGICYVDYTNNQFVPNFSHHKLSCFEYADGINPVVIDDDFQQYSTNRTDLEIYYEKIGLAYGQSSGRPISPDYPSSLIDIQPKIDEYRIVGSIGETVGISSIRSGDGVSSSKIITVTTNVEIPGLDVDTPFRIDGIPDQGYNGEFVVSEKISDTEIQYRVQNPPSDPLPEVVGSFLTLTSDTVTSASPYIYNISLRSVYGMCGLLADGNKATGFRSVVVAQFTGIGLQKDNNAFVLYDPISGTYKDRTVPGNENISTNSRAIFKPEYRNFHIKAINNAFIQNVSVFAIGFAEHFSVESGSDMSITNSNSNFGAKALVSSGFKSEAFPQDDQGYITHIIPPKEVSRNEISIEFSSIDVNKTIGVGSTGRLYLYNYTDQNNPPETHIEGYRFGAKQNDSLKVLISSGSSLEEYSADILMSGSSSGYEKEFFVGRTGVGINSISDNTLTLTSSHNFENGESIRIISDNGHLPDGLTPNTIYYAITDKNPASGISVDTEIKIAKTENDAISGTELTINSKGGLLKVVSRVSDKISGDYGHPIQFDEDEEQWYVNVSEDSNKNTIYSTIESLGTSVLGNSTPRTYFNRIIDDRNLNDTIYRVRYVIPSNSVNPARPPSDGFILQESGKTTGDTVTEIGIYFSTGSITNINEQRNFKFIANASWNSNVALITTELPHNLSVGSEVEILNVISTNNTLGSPKLGFNGKFIVSSIINRKQFEYSLELNPGTFANDTANRNTNLPYLRRKKYKNTYYIYRSEEIQKYQPGEQDGIYYLTILNASNSPSVLPFTNEKFSQPVKELYPQLNRDNPISDPKETKSFASSALIGEVVVDDVRNSLTKETITKSITDNEIGIGLTDIQSLSSTTHKIYTSIDHNLNRITKLSIINPGSGYGPGTSGDYYNATLVGFAGSTVGQYATAKVSIDESGSITDVKIMDGGSAYGIGNTLTISGIETQLGFEQAVVQVDQIYNNIGDVVKIDGIYSETYQGYNSLYRITNISTGDVKGFTAVSVNAIPEFSPSIGADYTKNSILYNTGRSISINSISYDHNTGIATFISNGSHGLKSNNKIRITGSNQNFFNGDFIVGQVLGLNSFISYIGISSVPLVASGTIFTYREGITSNDGNITIKNEDISGRMIPTYAGITTTLSVPIINASTEQINILNVQNLDINLGDYLLIDDEIVRVKSSVPSTPTNPITVFRGVLGTRASSHLSESVVRRIRVEPIELRRHSIMRASGHTFEYVGYGPGNYSTSLPEKQDRQISPQEELLSQSTRKDGGINFFSGMNDKGISYAGNKKLSTVTGQEEIFDTPIQTVTGEDIGNISGLNVISPIEANFERRINVGGGSNGKTLSTFNGPVIFNKKIVSTSPEGFETNSIFLQGETKVSRKFTISSNEPNLSGNPGDVTYFSNPEQGGYLGWIYTLDNKWCRFGNVSLSKDLNVGIFDSIGISTNNPQSFKFLVGSGTTQVSIDADGGVGIGISANNYKVNVLGDANISGNIYGNTFYGDGSGLININAAASGWTQTTGGIYNTSLRFVGIGTENPRFSLEVGSVSSNQTSLWVNGEGRFNNALSANNVNVTGIITANSYNLSGGTGTINSSTVTTGTLVVGTGGLTITSSGSNIGVGTIVPRSKLDVEGNLRIKTSNEEVRTLSITSNIVTIDLSTAQNFILNVTSNVNQFTIINPPSVSSSFTIIITQDSIGNRIVDIDDFRSSNGSLIPVYWPGGGVIPIITPTANRSDIYSFKTFNGGNSWYGVVVGQNFTN